MLDVAIERRSPMTAQNRPTVSKVLPGTGFRRDCAEKHAVPLQRASKAPHAVRTAVRTSKRTLVGLRDCACTISQRCRGLWFECRLRLTADGDLALTSGDTQTISGNAAPIALIILSLNRHFSACHKPLKIGSDFHCRAASRWCPGMPLGVSVRGACV